MTPVIILASLSVTAIVLVIFLVIRTGQQASDEPSEHGDGE